jgi:hypothetical protein
LDSQYNNDRPVMLLTDITCAQPSRKKNSANVGLIFTKLEENDIELGNFLQKPDGLKKFVCVFE